jgi:hypothetical protein
MTEPTMTLPIVFEDCPVCGGKKRLVEDYLNQLRAEGTIHKDSFKGGLFNQVPLIDPTHPPSILAKIISIKVILVYWDVCACGVMYCTKFECRDTPAEVQRQLPPMPMPDFLNILGKGNHGSHH